MQPDAMKCVKMTTFTAILRRLKISFLGSYDAIAAFFRRPTSLIALFV